ncbi:MAG: DctP family TRAP transporter solute-binding subunit [Alphaproteobacteria bacterium]|nr:DctP family TRAP transporter solute-binding subunit [Alphaproteobacteria bacterium]
MLKKILFAAVGATVLGVSASAATAAEYTFKFAHVLSTDTPGHMAAELLAKKVAENTGGKVAIEVFPAGQLGNDTEIVEQIQLGSIHMGIPPTAKLGNFEQRMQLFDLPFIFPTAKAAYAVLDGEIGNELLATLSAKGLYGAAYWESGFKQITTSVKPIAAPEDLAGIKMRTMSSPLIIQQYKAWGANPIPIAFAEVYNALQQGVAEAQENSFVSIDKMKFYEVQKYLTVSNHAYLGYAFIVNKAAWDGLPADLQSKVQAAIEEARNFQRAENARLNDSLLEKMKGAGLQITELDTAGITAFVEASKKVHDSYADVLGKGMLTRTYAVTNQHLN